MALWEDSWSTPYELETEAEKWEKVFAHHKPAAEQYGGGYRRAANDLRAYLKEKSAKWKRICNARAPYALGDAYALAGLVGLPPDQLQSLGRKRAFEYIEGGLVKIKRERMNRQAAESTTSIPCLITLRQMAAIVSKDKRTLERAYKEGKLPPPEVTGGLGKANEWKWSEVRGPLQTLFFRELPERFPADRFVNR